MKSVVGLAAVVGAFLTLVALCLFAPSKQYYTPELDKEKKQLEIQLLKEKVKKIREGK